MEAAEKKTRKKIHIVVWLIIFILSSAILGACLGVVEGFYQFGMYESPAEFKKEFNERLLRDYAVYALSDYQDDFNLAHLKNTNFEYAVYSAEYGEDVDLTKRSTYLVWNLPDEYLSEDIYDLFSYSATLGEYSNFYYNINSIFDANGHINNYSSYNDPSEYGERHDIVNVLYIWNTNSAYVVCDNNNAYPVSLELENRYGEQFWIGRELLNDEMNDWRADLYDDTYAVISTNGSDSFQTYLSDVTVCGSESLREYDVISGDSEWSLDLTSWSIWTNPGTDSISHANYYLLARVADPVDEECDDLFARSAYMVELACSLRYLPIILEIIFGIIALISFLVLVTRFFRWIAKIFKKISYQCNENVGLLWRMIGLCALCTFAEFVVLVGSYESNNEELIILGWVVQTLVLIPVFICCVLQLNKICLGAKRMAEGDLSRPIDTSHMFFDFKKIGSSINSASNGLELAVNERMKSERFKTELISNVSHDIKTPLTSIISYVELLKEQPAGEPANPEYLDVLEKQSVKLKKLLEDLIEASKASTGNIKAELTPCNVNMVLHQAIGEYKEKLEASQLDLQIRVPDEPVNILADTKHFQRVLDNLLVNVSKYAQPGTRVYINLSGGTDDAVIEIKNTSKEPLNMTSDELMERFTRGDSSRGSEGNGLGLSIAQSLMEVMHGKLRLVIDGDLFKVILLFPRLHEEQEAPADTQ